jgi:hypothetical protein
VFRDPDNIQLELFVHPTPEQLAELLTPLAEIPQCCSPKFPTLVGRSG